MKQYFTKVTADYWNPKNKLMDECQKTARSLDCFLIQEPDLDKFLEHFRNEIKRAHERNKRCKQLFLSQWSSPSDDMNIIISIDGVFTFFIYEVLTLYKPE